MYEVVSKTPTFELQRGAGVQRSLLDVIYGCSLSKTVYFFKLQLTKPIVTLCDQLQLKMLFDSGKVYKGLSVQVIKGIFQVNKVVHQVTKGVHHPIEL